MGPNLPLVVAFHGTGANENDGALEGAMSELDAFLTADNNNFIVLAPMSVAEGGVNADHEGGGPGWRFGGDATSNPDLQFVRAIVQEARRAFNIDARRVYFVGHSNGAFFSYFAAMKLADRVAAFAETSGGLIPCGNRVDCPYVATGATSCQGVMAQAPAECTCAISSSSFPTLQPTGRVPPAFLKHNADDSTVSAVFTCRLAEHLGANAQVTIDPTGEHGPTNNFMGNAWTFFSTRSLF